MELTKNTVLFLKLRRTGSHFTASGAARPDPRRRFILRLDFCPICAPSMATMGLAQVTSSAIDGSYTLPSLGRTKVFAVAFDDPTYNAVVYDGLVPA